ncbi:MAG TPA: hypothetical protein VKG66_02470, partial [Steroidobacteraceae bacterium]|nr:hypothetical protein [Steroidobacteraceae bacterium]
MNEPQTTQPGAPAPAAPAASSRRPLILLAIAALALVGWGVYYFLIGRYHVSTEDAYVNGN